MQRTTLALVAGAFMLVSAGSLSAQVNKEIQVYGNVSPTLSLNINPGSADLGTINDAQKFGTFVAATSNTISIDANTAWSLQVDPVGSGGTTVANFDYCIIPSGQSSCSGTQSTKSLLNDLQMKLTANTASGAPAPLAFGAFAGMQKAEVTKGNAVEDAEYAVALQSQWHWTNPPGHYKVTLRFTLAAQ